jgi:hypothetical protein
MSKLASVGYPTNPEEIVPIDVDYKQKINIEYLALKQVDRCNVSANAGDAMSFNNSVESLLSMLPKENRAVIESEKYKEQYITRVEELVYQYSCGRKMGTKEHPVYRNKPTDWNYNGGEPELVSPVVIEVEKVNYQVLYRLILSELQNVGVTWKIEPRESIDKKIKLPPTPLIRLNDGKMIRLLVERGVDTVRDNVKVLIAETPVVEETEETAEFETPEEQLDYTDKDIVKDFIDDKKEIV